MVQKKSSTLEERNPTWCRVRAGWKCKPERRHRAACGAAYGAWLAIVKGAAYLTDFTVDRSSRENPSCPPGAHVCKVSCNDSSITIVGRNSRYVFTAFVLRCRQRVRRMDKRVCYWNAFNRFAGRDALKSRIIFRRYVTLLVSGLSE